MTGEEISFTYLDGKIIPGKFEVEGGVITVTASDGRIRKATVEDGMLSPEILAKVILLLLRQDQ